MAESNFRVFAESVDTKDVETDNEYEVDSQRISGVTPGVAPPRLHNKIYKQATIMAAAIAQVIVQAGMDAKDSDYSELVANIRKSFAGSVSSGNNEKIKPDNEGNIDISSLLDNIIKLTYPRVGDLIITSNAENPAAKYPGTKWELLEEGTFLMSAGENQKAGSTGGNNTHTPSVDEIAPHAHSVTVSSNGAHSHERGDMEILGTLPLPTHTGRWDNAVTGAFSTEGRNGGPKSRQREGCDFRESWDWWDVTFSDFKASRSWKGKTSTSGGHSHEVTIEKTGKGKSWDNRPKFRAYYIWERKA